MSEHPLLGTLELPVPSWSVGEISDLVEREFGLSGDLTPLEGEREQNLLLRTPSGRYVVKIVRAAGSLDVLEMQTAALNHASTHVTDLDVPSPVAGEGGAVMVRARDDHVMRVLTYVAGDLLRDLPSGSVTAYQIGATVAKLQAALQGLFHPAAGRLLPWDARRAPALLEVLDAVPEPEVRHQIEAILTQFSQHTLDRLEGLPAQVIHNDLNPDNLVVTDGAITGVIDFGDMVHGPRVMDLAVAAAYHLSEGVSPADVLSEVVAGFESVSALADEERAVLPELVAVRLCQSILIGEWHAVRHPDNASYLLGDAEYARRALRSLEGVVWPAPAAGSAELGARRERVVAPGLRLSYEEPLHLVSGDGVWVEDAAGRCYLDAYNNVVQVGHGHPLIARALARQTTRLNTNTRYLTAQLVEYAEQLTALLPDGLDVCYFTNSGSEANDLAVRMARVVTGNDGVVVTDFAYHGSTTLVAAMSPEELGDRSLPEWVATVPPPGDPDAVGAVAGAVASLRRAGVNPAALILDTIFSSDGIYDPPGPYLDGSVQAIHDAGALYIADEVQAGLGRVGTRFWGFAPGTVMPDIVTLGKPIGNGHPMGAVITTKEIAGRFAQADYFFSTFGGNTVSAAVGSTVLEITRREHLAESAEEVGEYLRTAIRSLNFEDVGEIRGAGLFVGVELLTDVGDPDPSGAAAAVEGMKEQRVLIGRTGPNGNVLKIRPPLVFEHEHADLLLDALVDVL